MLDTIKTLSEFLTVPVLAFLGWSIFFIWSKQEKLYMHQIKVLKDENISLKDQLKSSEHLAAYDLMKTSLNDEIKLLKKEKSKLQDELTRANKGTGEFEDTSGSISAIDVRLSVLRELYERVVGDSGKIDLSKVIDQGNIKAFAGSKQITYPMKVSDLPDYLLEFAESNFHNQYLESDTSYQADALPEERKIKVLINDTRVSTFICFTDNNKVLLFDRSSNSELQYVKNDLWDCFGSVTFENISIRLKLGVESKFLQSTIQDIKLIPGFVYEDNIEPQSKCSTKQTVIMFGFIVYVSSSDLMMSISPGADNLRLFSITDNSPSKEYLTAKADIAMDFLRENNA